MHPRHRPLLGVLTAALLLAAPALAQAPPPEVLHYWAFNAGGTAPEAWPPPIPADLGTGVLEHDLQVDVTGHAAFAGTAMHAQSGYPAGNSFVPQGIHNNGRGFTLHVATTGYESVRVSYAAQRTASGFSSHAFAYSVDGGATYTDVAVVDDVPTAWAVRTVDLSAFPETTDAADLRIRVTLDGATNAQANGRFDNLTVTGTPVPPAPASVRAVHASPDLGLTAVDLYVGPATEPAEALVAGVPAFAGLPFQAATRAVELSSGERRVVVTAAGGTTPLLDRTLTLGAGEGVQLVLAGLSDPGAAVEGGGRSVLLLPLPGAGGQEGGGEAVAAHLVPGAPPIPLAWGGGAPADTLAYGGVTGGVALPATGSLEMVLELGGGRVARFMTDFGGRGGEGVTLVMSGVLAPPPGGEGPPPFGVFAVLQDGAVLLLPEETPLAGIHALPAGSLVASEGVVSRVLPGGVQLQDDASALAVRSAPEALRALLGADSLAAGMRLRVTGRSSLRDGRGEIGAGGLLQAELLGTGEAPAPAEATLAEIAAEGGRLEGRLVRVVGLTMAAGGVFAADTSYAVGDGTLEGGGTLRLPAALETELAGHPLPDGPFAFTGLLGGAPAGAPGARSYHLVGLYASDLEREEQAVGPEPTARVQVVHNAAGAALQEVDVYAGGERIISGLAFRAATPAFEVPASAPLSVVPTGSEGGSGGQTVRADLAPDGRFLLVLSDAGASEEGLPFSGAALRVYAGAPADTARAGGAGVVFVHGAPDAPVVEVTVSDEGGEYVAFGAVAFAEGTVHRRVTAGPLGLAFTPSEGQEGRAVAFSVDLSAAGGGTAALLSSGFLAPEAQGEGAATFGVLVVFEDGTARFVEPEGEEAPAVSSEPAAGAVAFRVEGAYPNPLTAAASLRVDLPAAAGVRVEVYDVLGRRVLSTAPVQAGPGAGHMLGLDASPLPPGTYVWRVVAETASGTLSQSGRMTVVR